MNRGFLCKGRIYVYSKVMILVLIDNCTKDGMKPDNKCWRFSVTYLVDQIHFYCCNMDNFSNKEDFT